MFYQAQRKTVIAIAMVATVLVGVSMWYSRSNANLGKSRFDSTQGEGGSRKPASTDATPEHQNDSAQRAMADGKSVQVPVGPVTFPDDPMDTYYSYFEARSEKPSLTFMGPDGGSGAARVYIEAHLAARQLRLAAKRLRKHEFTLKELTSAERTNCENLYFWHRADSRFQEFPKDSPKMSADTVVRMYRDLGGTEQIEIRNSNLISVFPAVLY